MIPMYDPYTGKKILRLISLYPYVGLKVKLLGKNKWWDKDSFTHFRDENGKIMKEPDILCIVVGWWKSKNGLIRAYVFRCNDPITGEPPKKRYGTFQSSRRIDPDSLENVGIAAATMGKHTRRDVAEKRKRWPEFPKDRPKDNNDEPELPKK